MSKITNKLNLPDALVQAVRNDDYDAGDSWRTVTQLVGPARKAALTVKHKHEITEDASELLYPLFGKLVHKILEQANRYDLTEQRLFLTVKGKLISGAFDSLELKNGVLTDWKFATIYQGKDGKPSEDWVNQLNLLALLLREHGHKVNEAQVVHLIRDHKKREAKLKETYPKLPIQKLAIPLWDEGEQWAYLNARIDAHLAAETFLPQCSDEERWSEEKWAIKKVGGKKAVNNCTFDDEKSAQGKLAELGAGYFIEYRTGENTRCTDYCSVAPWCEQFQKLRGVSNE